MQAKAINVFGGHQYLEFDSSATLISELVSAPIPMVGNTAKLVLLAYNFSGTDTASITASLEGSILGQAWDQLSDGGASLSDWGAATNTADATISHALIRVRVRVSAGESGVCRAWFNVGLALTEQ